LIFEKNANFFAKNCQKSQKIVIITLAPAKGSGVDVMIQTFSQFSPTFGAKKLAFFLNTNVMIKIVNNLPLF
jgi:hypothetical protein